MSTPPTKTIAFLGASTGIGLSALKSTLAASHTCIALCRVPSKLTAIFPPSTTPNLRIVEGNAHSLASVSACLVVPDSNPQRFVDAVVSTIGGKFIASKFTIDDPEVCRKGMATLLEAITELRAKGVQGRPHVVVGSTTGMSRFGRDIPLPMVPLYHVLLKVPHQDKIIMEDRLVGSGESFTVVRASFLVNGASEREVRVGIEDPKGGRRERDAIGYTISREDAGRWVAENLVLGLRGEYVGKIVTVTY